MAKYDLHFQGYYSQPEELPENAGIYCVFKSSKKENALSLVYIGQSDDIRRRLKEHESENAFLATEGELLVYSYALVKNKAARLRIEAALIAHFKPSANTQNISGHKYDSASFKLTGAVGILAGDDKTKELHFVE